MRRSIFLKIALSVTILLGVHNLSSAQATRPFWNEIQNFKHKDSLSMPATHGIVFLGSSSIRKWTDAETTFKSYNVINRGFGGSTLAQAADYVNELVFTYQPRQVVIYSGENDIAVDKISAEETLSRLQKLVTNIRTGMPNVPIVFMSIKQSPSRVEFTDVVLSANKLIKKYLKSVDHTTYLDVNAKMLDSKGATRPELFESDMLHLKPAGYAIWETALKPLLLKP
ncbi:GDSL-type esterase/lipase family protein [Pedobacter duraquae]|uniref:Lysophospholipase L1-like esterase n=1 Tax=Pedobacter duraquae TaxID=425511 RepID=A0A4R6IBX2_9SPHI|nr:GDSL-type esterase/lipase family protein [Pedobacter duraquae]TDO19723.1 lysophospholipase L1-like esterase [Pedobacter duraquae]